MARMQTKNPFLEEVAKLTEQAMGLAQAASEEVKGVARAQGERFAVELDLVRRDELDAVKAVLSAEIAALRAEIAALKAPEGSPEGASAVDGARPVSDAG